MQYEPTEYFFNALERKPQQYPVVKYFYPSYVVVVPGRIHSIGKKQ